MGQEIPVELEMNSTILMEIVDKTAQETTVKFTYKEMAYIVSSPIIKMGYDSKNPVENPSDIDLTLSKIIGKMLGQSFTAIVAPDGAMKSISGTDAIGESMIAAVSPDNPIEAQIGTQMRMQFNDDGIRNFFAQPYNFYPANAVRIGDSWNIDSETTINDVLLDMSTTYTLKGTLKYRNRDAANITFESKIEMNPSLLGVDGKFTGKNSGTTLVDVSSGLPMSHDLTQTITGTMNVQEMSLQMEMNATTKTTITEVN